jgi:outer membrane protein assembly factor BamB
LSPRICSFSTDNAVVARRDRKILVTGLFGTCQDTAANSLQNIIAPDGSTVSGSVDHNAAACYDNWHRDDPNCKANLGSPCILNSDCTGDPNYLTCANPVDTSSTFVIKRVGQGSDNCDPACNGVASFTATVDFSQNTDATSVYSIQKGCYDERYANGMRRLGSSGSGAGSQNVHLDWKTLIPNGEIVATPLVYSNGDVVVASARGSLTKLSPSGEKYWSVYVGPVVGNPALGSDGTIYFGSGDRNIWAVTSNGITRWRYTTPQPLHSSPLVTDAGIYIGDRNGTFYRFNLDGSVAWKYYTNGEIWGGSAMTRDGKIVFGSLDTYLYCLDSTTGVQIWNHSVGQEIVGTPLIQDVSIVYATREDDDEYGQIICLKMDGSVRWTYTVSSSVESKPAEGPNGEVFVATVDGKIFAIQADGQLMWKYNTGGTGGVCRRTPPNSQGDVFSTYATEKLSVDTGDTNANDGSSVVLGTNPNTAPRYYISGVGPKTTDGFYTGYRASFKIASGVLRKGQFKGVTSIKTTYAGVAGVHDTHFTDSSSQDTAIVLKFTAQDRMVPGEVVQVVLPGLVTTGTDAAKDVYPKDSASATSGGQFAFAGSSGTSQCPTGCTNRAIKLDTTGCGQDDACLGSTITFTAGTGAGQTATIVDYVHTSKIATITYVPIVGDATTTYTISSAIIPKFTATYTFADPTATLTLEVPYADGTMDCASGCTGNKVKLASSASGIITNTANVLNGYFIQITGGTGAGQTTYCNKYYGNGDNYACDVDTLPIIPDQTSTFRIGPMVESGEDTTIVIPAAVNLKHPHFSGAASAAGTTATTQIKLATTASTKDDFYNGMRIAILRQDATSTDGAVSTLVQTTVTIVDTATNRKIQAGTYIKINSEVMKVLSVDSGATDKQLTVERGQLGTARAVHSNGDAVKVFEFRQITDYDGGTKEVTFTPAVLATAAGDFYRVTGVSSEFEVRLGDIISSSLDVDPLPWTANLVPTTYSTTQGQVTLADESGTGTRANADYVGAILAVTDGPGKGLKGEITGYTKSSGVATVQWNLDYCGDPSYCTPAGDQDAGTCKDTANSCAAGTVVRKASHYEIQLVGAVTSYVGSTKTLSLTQLPGSGTFSVPDLASYCDTFDSADLMWRCTSYANVKTPVYLEYASGSWCAAGGGTGWGATSPCVSNGLVVTTSANKYVYGLGLDGVVKFKYMTGKRIKSGPR